jgi:MFS family permease
VIINALSCVDRQLLPAFASQISADLELSRQQFGILTGFARVAVYVLSGPLMGMLADRYNPSRVIAAGILGRLVDAHNRATVFGLFFMGSHIDLGLAYWLAADVLRPRCTRHHVVWCIVADHSRHAARSQRGGSG